MTLRTLNEEGELQYFMGSNHYSVFSILFYRKDTFSIHCSDLGTLTQVVIRHDNSGVGPSWYLEGVEVVDRKEKGDQKTKFPCGRWLEMCDGCGGVLKVELLPEAVAGKIEKKGGDGKSCDNTGWGLIKRRPNTYCAVD